MRKSNYIIITFILLIFFTIISVLVARYYILEKEQDLLEKNYETISHNIQDKVNSLIQSKRNATLALTLTLSQDEKIKDFLLLKSNEKDLKLDKLSNDLKDNTDFKNVWFQVVNKDGISIYRSWTDNKNDKIQDFRLDLQELSKNPQIKSTISVGKYDLTFKTIVPIFDKNEFLGFLEGITHFNSITKDLKDFDVDSIVIVEKKFTKQLLEKSFTKLFLKDYYIANVNVSKELLSYLEKENIDELVTLKNRIIKDNNLIVNVPIIENNIKIASLVNFRSLNSIDISQIEEFKKHAFVYLILFVILLCMTLFLIAYYIYSKKLKELNIVLEHTVNKEILKNDEKNRVLFQQNKMAAMGEMIGNIAHQWRQPLSVITAAASSLKVKKEFGILEEKDYDEALTYIVDTANYLSNTIDDFRYYFSPNKNKNIFNTQDFINKCIKLVNVDFNEKNIVVVKDIESININNYENELLQVAINILNNAKDELSKKDYDRYIFITLVKDEDDLILEIKDNAGGIEPSIMDRIFEPYFTTKHKSKGTGIGLYMCEEIIVKHIKGEIEVSNSEYEYEKQLFKGAVFKITIPLLDE